MPQTPSTILLIDPDEASTCELAALLLSRQEPVRLFKDAQVRKAAEILYSEQIDWLFIRIAAWDDYQGLASSLTFPPRRVVFLSGRNEKCTGHVDMAVDGHLQPPFRASRLAKTMSRLSDPHFSPRPLDIFFVKSHARYVPVRYCDLQAVNKQDGNLLVRTRYAEYKVTESLQAFQDRMPIPLSHIRRGCLINEAFVTDRWQPASDIKKSPDGSGLRYVFQGTKMF